MSERYSKLYSLPENLYAEGAPVVVSAGNLLKDNQTEKVLAQLKIKNISNKTIKAAKVLVHAQDTTGKAIDGDAEQEYLDLSVEQGEEFGQKVAIALPNASTRGFSVEVKQVVFNDNSAWEGTGKAWEPLPVGESLSQWLGDAELVKQYQLHFGGKCESVPQEHKDLWCCTCGEWNKSDNCYCCGKAKAEQLTLNLDVLKADKDARLTKEKAEREAKEAADKAAAMANAKKAKKVLTILAPIIVLCVIVAIVTVKVVVPNSKYQKATEALNAGKYDEAVSAFEEMDDYKDSAEKIEEAKDAQYTAINQPKYERANALAQEGKLYEAAVAFYEIKGYLDSWDRCFALWGEITQRETIFAEGDHTIAAKANGSAIATGNNERGQCNVASWSDLVAVSAGEYHSMGLRADGSVLIAGNGRGTTVPATWEDIVAISGGNQFSVGLKADGTVLADGYNPDGQCDVTLWKDIVAISAGYCHTIGLKSDGTVVATGKMVYGSLDVSDWKDIIMISAGNDISIGLKKDGTAVVAHPSKKIYESDERPNIDISSWKKIVAVAAGYDHVVGLRADGTVVALGGNSHGQCDVSDWKNIVAIAAGDDYTIGLCANGTLVSTGSNNDGERNVSSWADIQKP